MKIALLGDIALVGQFGDNKDLDRKLGYLKNLLDGYDYVIANLESPLTNRRKTMIPKSMHLRTDVQNIDILKYLGVRAVTLANNHSYDYGRKGLEETCACLTEVGIKYYGIDGISIVESIKGEKISLSGFCCLSTNGMGYNKGYGNGINLLTRENVEKQIKKDIENSAMSIISVHCGIEHTNYPSLEHISLFNHVLNCNNAVIHGHHPHQIQGVIQQGNSLIAYSLGNAIFDSTTSLNGSFSVEMSEENRKSFILGVEIISGKVVDYNTVGFYIGDSGIIPYDISEELASLSSAISEIKDKEAYSRMRKSQYKAGINQKFGKHDFKWLKSRMNYNSIGAKVYSKIYKARYKRISNDF